MMLSSSTTARAARPAAARRSSCPANARVVRPSVLRHAAADGDNGDAPTTTTTTAAPPAPAAAPPTAAAAPKKRKRQADSTDAVATFLTRRFGIAGGLAWLGVLTFGVVSEQVKTRRELREEQQGTREVAGGAAAAAERALPSGVSYRELRVGGGARPQRGDLAVLEFSARYATEGGSFAEPPFADTRSKKPAVLVWGARPLPAAAGICEGVVEAIADGMRAGGRRVVTVPASAAAAAGFGDSPPPGVPPGAALQYDVTLSRVSVAPS